MMLKIQKIYRRSVVYFVFLLPVNHPDNDCDVYNLTQLFVTQVDLLQGLPQRLSCFFIGFQPGSKFF